MEIQAQGDEALQRLAFAYKAGAKDLRARVRRTIAAEAKPLAAAVVKEGSEQMPETGGFRARLGGARGSIGVSLATANPTVSIRIRDSQKDRIRAIDSKGSIRHPVFGNKSVWVDQSVPEGAWSNAFKRQAPLFQRAVYAAASETLRAIAAEVDA